MNMNENFQENIDKSSEFSYRILFSPQAWIYNVLQNFISIYLGIFFFKFLYFTRKYVFIYKVRNLCPRSIRKLISSNVCCRTTFYVTALAGDILRKQHYLFKRQTQRLFLFQKRFFTYSVKIQHYSKCIPIYLFLLRVFSIHLVSISLREKFRGFFPFCIVIKTATDL